MEIIGRGHKAIVVAGSADTVRKLYLSPDEGRIEQAQLDFLADLGKTGFDIGCTIPKLLEAMGEGRWEIDGRTYVYCNRMERVPGTDANRAILDFTAKRTAALGRDLGNIIYDLHTLSKPHLEHWKRLFQGEGDMLLDHIFDDKVAQILREETDPAVIERVEKAARYLEDRRGSLIKDATLSHRDLSLPNVMVAKNGHVNGLVDWSGFGLAEPSLSLYQLSYTPAWPEVKRQYESRGGRVREDIAYAAAAINLAWAPIICTELGFQPGKYEQRSAFYGMYDRFGASLAD